MQPNKLCQITVAQRHAISRTHRGCRSSHVIALLLITIILIQNFTPSSLSLAAPVAWCAFLCMDCHCLQFG
eukprot:jgi/Chrzof1/2272/Cz11g09120.t1